MDVNLSPKVTLSASKPDDPMTGTPDPKVRPIILAVDEERKDFEFKPGVPPTSGSTGS